VRFVVGCFVTRDIVSLLLRKLRGLLGLLLLLELLEHHLFHHADALQDVLVHA